MYTDSSNLGSVIVQNLKKKWYFIYITAKMINTAWIFFFDFSKNQNNNIIINYSEFCALYMII